MSADQEGYGELQELAAITAINNMLRAKHFSICTLDNVLRMLGKVAPKTEYNVLHTLHCIDYADMPPLLRERIPQLLDACLQMPVTFQFPYGKESCVAPVVILNSAEKGVTLPKGPSAVARLTRLLTLNKDREGRGL